MYQVTTMYRTTAARRGTYWSVAVNSGRQANFGVTCQHSPMRTGGQQGNASRQPSGTTDARTLHYCFSSAIWMLAPPHEQTHVPQSIDPSTYQATQQATQSRGNFHLGTFVWYPRAPRLPPPPPKSQDIPNQRVTLTRERQRVRSFSFCTALN